VPGAVAPHEHAPGLVSSPDDDRERSHDVELRGGERGCPEETLQHQVAPRIDEA
jgi:hypothetical protein